MTWTIGQPYKGKAPVKKGDKVELLILDEVWTVGTVNTVCATQFTCTANKNTLFFFYADKGVTWRTHE